MASPEIYKLLDDGSVEPATIFDLERELEGSRKVIGNASNEKFRVSTVFLGVDHAIIGKTPLLFETMIFSEIRELGQFRYSTIAQAIEGHDKLVGNWLGDVDRGWGEVPISAGLVPVVPASREPPSFDRDLERLGRAIEGMRR